jgi:hypothetical protein
MLTKLFVSSLISVSLVLLLPFSEKNDHEKDLSVGKLKWAKSEFRTDAKSVTSFAQIIENDRELLFFGCYERGMLEVYEKNDNQTTFKKSLRLPSKGLRDISVFKSDLDQYTVAVAGELASKLMVIEYDGRTNQLNLIRSYNAREVSSVVVEDLNQDGYTDILVGANGMDSFWLENLGGEDYRKKSIGRDFANVKQIRSLDYNGDGKMDIVAASDSRKGIAVGINQGDGTFKVKSLIPDISGVLDFSVRDIDNDQDLDIVVASHKEKGLTVFTNNFGQFKRVRLGKVKNLTSVVGINLPGSNNLSFLVTSFDKSYVTLFYARDDEMKEVRLKLDLTEPTKLSIHDDGKNAFKLMASSFSSGRFTEIDLNLFQN